MGMGRGFDGSGHSPLRSTSYQGCYLRYRLRFEKTLPRPASGHVPPFFFGGKGAFPDYARQHFSNFWDFEQLFENRAISGNFCLHEQLLSFYCLLSSLIQIQYMFFNPRYEDLKIQAFNGFYMPIFCFGTQTFINNTKTK